VFVKTFAYEINICSLLERKTI